MDTAGRPDAARIRGALRVVAALGAIAVVATAFPRLIGASWPEIVTAAARVPASVVALLVFTWAIGLAAHTITLTAALPGLSHRRALLLSLTGSAVANVLPLGGAAGIALNDHMTRRWGFSRAGFASYTVVTNVWDVLAKMLLPLLLVPLVLGGGNLGHHAGRVILGSALIVTTVGLAAALLLFSPALRRVSDWLEHGSSRSRWRARTCLGLAACERVRVQSARVAVHCWKRLTTGMALYTGLLFALLLVCLWASKANVPLTYALLAFCGERLLTLVGVTPGAIGFVEVGLAALLMLAPTASGAGVAAAVLLYRLLTFAVEIPVGGALLAVWLWRGARGRPANDMPVAIGAGG